MPLKQRRSYSQYWQSRSVSPESERMWIPATLVEAERAFTAAGAPNCFLGWLTIDTIATLCFLRSYLRWHTTDNLRPNHTHTTPHFLKKVVVWTHTTTFSKSVVLVWCTGCGVGVVWPHHTHTTTFLIKCVVWVWLWCWCGLDEGCQLCATVHTSTTANTASETNSCPWTVVLETMVLVSRPNLPVLVLNCHVLVLTLTILVLLLNKTKDLS